MQKYIYFWYEDWEELYTDALNLNIDIEFYYKDEKYMISTETLGTRKHPEIKRCLSYQSGGHEKYLETLQVYDTWEELLIKAKLQDGRNLIDAMYSNELTF